MAANINRHRLEERRKIKADFAKGPRNCCGEAALEAQLATFAVQRAALAQPGPWRFGDLGTGANRGGIRGETATPLHMKIAEHMISTCLMIG